MQVDELLAGCCGAGCWGGGLHIAYSYRLAIFRM